MRDSLMQRWNNYWFSPRPYVDLAMLRIIAVATQLLLMLSFQGGAVAILQRLQQFEGLPDQLYVPITVLKLILLPFGWDARPSLDLLYSVYYLTILVGVLALIGLATRISTFAFALGNIFLVSYLYSFGDFHHTEAPLFIALVLLSLSPAGRTLSVDAILRKRRGKSEVQEGTMAGWPILLLQWLFVLIYLSAVLSKLVFHGTTDWLNGYTLQYYLIADSLRKDGTLLGLWLSEHHRLVLVSQYVIVIFQATFVLAVIYPLLRWIYIPMAIGFHIGNILFLDAPFPQWIALILAIFIPWKLVFDAIDRFQKAKRGGKRISNPHSSSAENAHVATTSLAAVDATRKQQ